jgi:hypothetical protein
MELSRPVQAYIGGLHLSQQREAAGAECALMITTIRMRRGVSLLRHYDLSQYPLRHVMQPRIVPVRLLRNTR